MIKPPKTWFICEDCGRLSNADGTTQSSAATESQRCNYGWHLWTAVDNAPKKWRARIQEWLQAQPKSTE